MDDREHEIFNILVVDDEKPNLDVLDYILSPLYNVLIAKNGQAALRIARSRAPDLILLDVIMPDMTGYEVLAELKESDATRNIPVIFITGLDSVEDEEKGLSLGASDYITKPFHNSIVKARVKTNLQVVSQLRIIERLSMIDVLTDLPNRRSFNKHIDTEWKRAIRDRSPVSLLIMDIDKFKLYNDTYGHPQGDVLLETISKVFRDTLKRPGDFVARWGGEEFVVCLPSTDLSGAFNLAERLRENVEDTLIPCADGTITRVTVSIGVSSETPKTESSLNDFISKADQALYMAKNTGRNRVSIGS